MIACLRGELISKNGEKVVIDVNGVGYEVFIPATCQAVLPESGQEVFLHIYTDVREDAINLFGFSSSEEKEMFVILISVSGIGPKLAINVVSGMRPGDFARAISSDDLGRLIKLPGVGKKTAERLCLELKEKVRFVPDDEKGIAASEAHAFDDELSSDVISALINLGYPRISARKAVEKVRRQHSEESYRAMGFDELIRQSLRGLA